MKAHLIFRHRAFVYLWASRLLMTTGTMILGVAIGWQVYNVARLTLDIERSSFLVGMVGLAQFLPLFALALLAGATADRYDRRKIILICSGLQLTCATTFAVMAFGAQVSLTALFAVAALFGVARAFVSPASSALGPSLVPKEILPQAVAWSTLSVQGGMVVGPWLGGVLCMLAPFWAYVAAGLLYALAGVCCLLLLWQPLNVKVSHNGASRLMMIREGLAYLKANKIVLGAISLDLFAVFLGGATALLPVYARDILHVGADGFGLLRSGPALGGGVVTIWIGFHPIRRHAGPWMLTAVALFGVATILFAISKILWFSVLMLVLLGAADSVSVFVRQSLVQIVTPNPMRGRVSAVSGLFISASNELGEFESGVAARIMGPVVATIFGGAGAMAVTALWCKLFPALRQADRLEAPEL